MAEEGELGGSESADRPLVDESPVVHREDLVGDAGGSSFRGRTQIILMWQGVSLLVTGTAAFSQLLADKGVNLPTTQSFCNYLALGIIYGYWLSRERARPREAWWRYALIALCDVEGNFLLVLAYQYTSITSVQLLDCFSIPVVMGLSYAFLKVRYRTLHYTGALVSLVGLGLLVLVDTLARGDGGNEKASNRPLGDMLVVIGTTFYGVSNVAQEYMVKERSRIEFLANLGVFGAIISGLQMAALERDAIRDLFLRLDGTIAAYLFGFNACLLGMYTSVPVLLARSSATFMNLSLLTADFYSLLIALFLFAARPFWAYFVAFAIIVSGLVAYNMAGEPAPLSLSRHGLLPSSSDEAMGTHILSDEGKRGHYSFEDEQVAANDDAKESNPGTHRRSQETESSGPGQGTQPPDQRSRKMTRQVSSQSNPSVESYALSSSGGTLGKRRSTAWSSGAETGFLTDGSAQAEVMSAPPATNLPVGQDQSADWKQADGNGSNGVASVSIPLSSVLR